MSAHKWWRATNWKHRLTASQGNHADDILLREFVLNTGIDETDANVISVKNKAWGSVSNLVDGSSSPALGSLRWAGASWWIQYSFNVAKEPKSLKLIGWHEYGLEIKSVELWYSDDGVNFKYWQTAFINQEQGNQTDYFGYDFIDITLLKSFQTKADFLTIQHNQKGKITANVTELGAPIGARVTLFDRITNRPVAIQHSDNNGIVTFTGHDADREYFLHAVHPERANNAVTQDMIHGNFDALKASGYYDNNN